jgi:hypothetical protein
MIERDSPGLNPERYPTLLDFLDDTYPTGLDLGQNSAYTPVN